MNFSEITSMDRPNGPGCRRKNERCGPQFALDRARYKACHRQAPLPAKDLIPAWACGATMDYLT
jgi:hypothetical protein